MILLDPLARPLTLAECWAVAGGAAVAVGQGAWPRIAASAEAVAAIVAAGEPAYGINTGFGKLARVRIPDADLGRLQLNLVRSHQAGVGPALPPRVARLALALKVQSLAHGLSGVRRETVALMVGCLARDVLPAMPAQGSVGASGDLAPLASLAAMLIGEGEAMRGDVRGPSRDVLAGAGLAPVTLGPKEGLAILNGTQVSTALAVEALRRLATLFDAALVTGALSVDAAAGSDAPFDPRIHAARGHRGQGDVAATLARLLRGSAIRESHRAGDERVQDPYSLRCQPQVMGAGLDLLRAAGATLRIEANGVTDNPLVLPGTDGEPPSVISGGNFHAEPVAFAADTMALVAAEIGNIAERRIALLVDPATSGLPAFLTPRPGLNSGFMIPQVTAAALASENKMRAAPASIDTIPTSANQEDHVSMATHAARRLGDMADNLARILAVEALAAAQGLDLRAPLATSAPLSAARDAVRALAPPLNEDRAFTGDIEAVAALAEAGGLAEAAGVATPFED